MTTSPLHLVCPHCDKINRLPAERLGESPTCGACGRPLFAQSPLTLTDANFDRHLQRNDIPLLVDFWAPWCGPCRTMAPAFAEAARRLEPHYRLAKLNTEDAPAIAARFAIRSIPTIALFRGGREVARQAGALDLGSLLRWVEGHR